MPKPEIVQLLRDEDTLATTLLVWALDELGPEMLQWHPYTIRQEAEAALGAKLPDDNFDKLMAAVAVIMTDLFFKNATAFSHLAPALCGDGFDPGEFDPPDSAECAWAITEALLLAPPDEEEPEPFSDDVRRFVGHVLREDGFTSAPDVLAIALDWSKPPLYLDDDVKKAASQMQEQREDDIKAVMRDGLRALADQLEQLELRQGDASEIVQKVRKAFAARVASEKSAMSHIAVKKTKAGEPLIVDLDAVKMAAAALGLVCEERKHYAWWGHHVGDFKIPAGFSQEELGNNAVLVLSVPEEKHAEMRTKYGPGHHTGKPYELAIVRDPNNPGCYSVMYDFIGGGYGLEDFIGHPIGANAKTGEVEVLAPKFIQYYRMYADRIAAHEVEDDIEFEPLPDGSWVSYTKTNEERLDMSVEEEIQRLIQALSYADLCRIMENVVWDIFGGLDENKNGVLMPERTPKQADLMAAAMSLRQELWPIKFPPIGEKGE